MSEITFRFKGWMVVPAIVLVVGLGLWRHQSLQHALDNDVAEKIRVQIAAEIARNALPDLSSGFDTAHADEVVNNLVSPEDVELINPSSKGVGDEVVVRFEIRVNGEPLSTGDSVRYYELERVLDDWQIRRECTRWTWILRLY